jgi:hypothetical protein
MKYRTSFALSILLTLLLAPTSALAWSSGILGSFVQVRALSTHDKILSAAFDTATKGNPELQSRIPSLDSIRSWEGLNGPDGEWMRGQDNDSHHYVDLSGQTEDAAYMAQKLAEELHKQIGTDSVDSKSTARLLAYIAHYVADALSPPHTLGHSIPGGERMNDWDDPNWDNHTIVTSSHFRFETQEVAKPVLPVLIVSFLLSGMISVYAIMRARKHARRARRIGQRLLSLLVFLLLPVLVSFTTLSFQVIEPSRKTLKPLASSDIASIIRTEALRVRQSHVWDEYVTHGWSSKVEHETRENILPTAVTLTAEIWLGALERP